VENLCLVAAFGTNGQVGLNNKLPWNLPQELKHFRETTQRATVIMGRKTFESIGHPLPNRVNIVISKRMGYIPGAEVYPTLDDALLAVKKHPRVYIIGGPGLWQAALREADFLVFSEVNYNGVADACLPENFFEEVRNDFQIKMVRHNEEFSATFWKRAGKR
jgi:dihydrofolate reductase